jgi:hypothetical protein
MQAQQELRKTLAGVADYVRHLDKTLKDPLLREKAVAQWEMAGGFVKWSSAGNALFRRRDGRAVKDLEQALRSWMSK